MEKYYIIVIDSITQLGIIDERTLDELLLFFNKHINTNQPLVELNSAIYKDFDFQIKSILFNLNKLSNMFEVTKEDFIEFFDTSDFSSNIDLFTIKEGATYESI